MKTRILFAFLILALAVQSQSLVLTFEGETLDPNAEITVEGSPWVYEIVSELDVTNSSTGDINVLVQRYDNNTLPNTTNAICLGLCYDTTVSLTPNAMTVAAGQTVENIFSGHYYPNNVVGISPISYVFFDENNPNDSTMVTVHYDAVSTGIYDKGAVVAIAYPSPANEKLVVNLNLQSDHILNIELYSMNGKLIETVTTVNGIAVFLTSDLEDGIYLYRVLNNKQVLYSNRVIVKH